MRLSLDVFQKSVRIWILQCFDSKISDDKQERNQRFLEEALELVQSCGMSPEYAHRLVDYVYSRPAGHNFQEVGGTLVTLAALCGAQSIYMSEAAECELARIQQSDVMEKIRAKQATKPQNSPLPGDSEPDIRL
jgi:hypothetical protein